MLLAWARSDRTAQAQRVALPGALAGALALTSLGSLTSIGTFTTFASQSSGVQTSPSEATPAAEPASSAKPSSAKPSSTQTGSADAILLLHAARRDYEAKLEALRLDIEQAFQSRRDNLPASAEGVRVLETIDAQSRAFDAQGSLAGVARSEEFVRRYAKLADDLTATYDEAIRASLKARQSELASRLTGESRVFRTHRDLVPWGANLLQDRSPSDRTLPPGEAMRFNLPHPGEFRLEIIASALDAAAPTQTPSYSALLDVEFPVADVGTARARAIAHNHALVFYATILQDEAVADSGVAEPARIDANAGMARPVITLRSLDAPVLVESVRVKPLVRGTPPSIKQKRADPKGDPRRDDAEGRDGFAGTTGPVLRAGTPLVGESGWTRSRTGILGKVDRLSADSLVLLTWEKGGNNSRIEWVFDRAGEAITLRAMNRKGQTQTYRVNEGTGSVRGSEITFRADYTTIQPDGRERSTILNYTLKVDRR
ncbi:MAG: hypothetical protein SFZ23_10920 [Planctomycetota bacterium]|nr:hypothetical protein [Planctomycetota bacterium]